jgi:hypothetical protein
MFKVFDKGSGERKLISLFGSVGLWRKEIRPHTVEILKQGFSISYYRVDEGGDMEIILSNDTYYPSEGAFGVEVVDEAISFHARTGWSEEAGVGDHAPERPEYPPSSDSEEASGELCEDTVSSTDWVEEETT